MSRPSADRLRRWFGALCRFYTLALIAFIALRPLAADRWWYALPADFTPWLFLPLLALAITALSLRARGAFLFALPLLIVGLGWYGRYYIPHSIELPITPVLTIATANVLYSNGTPERFTTWVRETSPDVVCLQEVTPPFQAGALESLQDLYPYRSSGIEDGAFGVGIVVLSKMPFVTSDGEFQLDRHVIAVDGRQITIYCVHEPLPVGDRAHFPLIPNHLFTNVFFRYDQTRRDLQILDLLNRVNGESLPVIVGGDFNMSDHSRMYGVLAAYLGDSFREAGTGLGYTYPSAEYFRLPAFFPPLLRIDYIWHSSELRAMRASVGSFTGSDHLPVITSFAWATSDP